MTSRARRVISLLPSSWALTSKLPFAISRTVCCN
ncbi:Uncharacterised protein [Vibrio cholerae]|nr:Uncharacterised protein [Vibrio cholerae]